MHSQPREENVVNGEILDLAAWDHRPGAPRRHGWRDLHTGTDVRLDNVNQPSSYERLTDEEKAIVQGFIARELVPADEAGRFGSYGLKHIFDRLPGGFSMTNGAFKGAMLDAGFLPIDPYGLTWRFGYKLADRQLFERSCGRAS